ncbi:MAG: hypothetical protein ACP5E2_16620, partial [Terracidiphilus sp.]
IERKCAQADAAKWFLKNPDELALVNKPEPWPGKDRDFFQASANASMSGTRIVQSKVSVTPAEKDAWGQETAWCGAQLAWRTGRAYAIQPPAKTFSVVSSACVAAQGVTPPAPF